LGLAVTRRIIEEHNGTIEVESQPGKGTTFTLLLPMRT
jgi:signal transduction histidine kinase